MLSPPCSAQATQRVYDRVVDGIASVLLTLKKRPVIRYSQTCVRGMLRQRRRLPAHARRRSETAKRIAQDVRRLAYEQARMSPALGSVVSG